MATVKRVTRDGTTRILTKSVDGSTRVSCQCCLSDLESNCCMYPGIGLGALYEREDLPNTLTIISGSYDYTIELTLLQSGQNIYEGEVVAEGVPNENGRLIIIDGVWELQRQNPESGNWNQAQDWGGQNCLFYDYSSVGGPDWPLTPSSEFITYPVDDFADAYSASCNGGPSKTYTRESLCVWRSRRQDGEIDGQLYYRTGATSAEAERSGKGRILWYLDGAGYRSANDGPYNSPEGHYGKNRQCVVTA